MAKKALQVFFPAPLFDVETLDEVIEDTLDEIALAVKTDLRVIVRTWSRRPGFSIDREKYYRLVHAYRSEKAGRIFDMLDAGTPRHPITARNAPALAYRKGGFVAKTTPKSLYSGAGQKASGPLRRPVQVEHPGTEPREWYDTVTEKWEKEAPDQFQRAIDAAISRMGTNRKTV